MRLSASLNILKESMNFRRILPIFIIVFTNILGAGVILPILPLVAEGQFVATVLQATTLGAVFFAAQFIAAPWLGRLSDRIGRRPVLIVSQIGTVLSFVMFSLAAPIGNQIDASGIQMGMSGGLMILFLARILDGITGGNITTAQAYISDVSSEDNRAQALGTLSAAFGLGFIFGPAFGGFLATVSLVAPFIGAAIITSGSVLLTAVMLKESLPPEARATVIPGGKQTPASYFVKMPTVFLILTITFAATLAFSALQSTFALFAERVLYPEIDDAAVVARNVGLILTVIGVFTVLTQGILIKPLVQNYGERTVVIIGQAALMIAFAGLAAASNPWLVTFIGPLIAMGNGLTGPSLQSLITRFGSRQDQGQLLGIYQSARSIALIIGPIFAGLLFQAISPRAPYITAVPLIAISIGLGTLLKRQAIPSQQVQVAKEVA
jgi:MFS transporter, DHA1 family, tetracycline resistance protein